MKLSIIIPTFNSSDTIKVCLESIVNQTFEDKEVWIIDGLSTDNTIEIIKEYASKFQYIHWISEKDQGIYDAMNKGIDLANGKWLYFLGSDDWLVTNSILESVFKNSNIQNFDFIYGNVIYGDSNKVYCGIFNSEKILHFNLCHQSVFARKNVLLEKGKFDLTYFLCADWLMNIHIFYDTNLRICYLEKIISFFSTNGRSTTSISEDNFYNKLLELRNIKPASLNLFDRVRFKIYSTPVNQGLLLQFKNLYLCIFRDILSYLGFKSEFRESLD